jgi:hypothetical protein
VVTDRDGRKWLARYSDAILTQATTPFYGVTSQQGRAPDAIVAKLRWSRGILDRPPNTRDWFLFHQAGIPAPCLTNRIGRAASS